MNYTKIRISFITILKIKNSNFDITFNLKIMKKSLLKPIKIDSMLYQRTYEDFNNEKPNPLDPTQIKVHPIEEEKDIKSLKKQFLNQKK